MRTTRRITATTFAMLALATSFAGTAVAQELEGNVVISGSSTVEPVSLILAEEFNFFNPNWTYTVEGPGTTSGFEQFCNGEIDVSNASRRIKDSELDACAASGVEPVEIKIAIDGLAVITNSANEALQCLDFAALYAIFGPESNDIRSWADAQALAQELGSSNESWPDGDIAITAPGDESGTHDSFIEIVIADIAAERGQEDRLRTPGDIYIASPNDNVIIDGIAGFPTSIGFVGYAFAKNNPDKVRMIAVDGGSGCAIPNEQTVTDGSYPIARDLFIYPDAARLDPASAVYNAAIAPYVDFYLSDESAELVSFVGYVPLRGEALEASRATWNEAKAAADS
ncbi:MAG: PstS family phosphate ABC transporter substrate-binding protein [Chloroflexota bacterium]